MCGISQSIQTHEIPNRNACLLCVQPQLAPSPPFLLFPTTPTPPPPHTPIQPLRDPPVQPPADPSDAMLPYPLSLSKNMNALGSFFYLDSLRTNEVNLLARTVTSCDTLRGASLALSACSWWWPNQTSKSSLLPGLPLGMTPDASNVHASDDDTHRPAHCHVDKFTFPRTASKCLAGAHVDIQQLPQSPRTPDNMHNKDSSGMIRPNAGRQSLYCTSEMEK